MPKKTFFNLNIEKQQKIRNAIINEFSRNTIAKTSISNIVEEAQIPRGSFYQYFVDKEDALKYIIDGFIKSEKDLIRKFLKTNGGDIFKTSIDIFNYVSKKSYNEKDMVLCSNIMQKLKEDSINIFDEINKEQLINTTILKIDDKDDIKCIMKILTIVIRNSIMDVLKKRKSEEEAEKELKKQIKILKRGMENNK